MRRWTFALVSLLSILVLTVIFPTVATGQELKETVRVSPPSPRYKPGEVMVWFRPGTPGRAKAAAHAAVQGQVLRQYRIVPELQEVRLPKGMSVEQGIARYKKNPNVLRAYPNYPIRLDTTPDDPEFVAGYQWGLNNTGQTGGTPDADIDAPEAWDLTTGSRNVVVAVVDTGIDYNHPDLMANMFQNTQDCNPNGIDDDGNGYVDDCYGIDTANNDSNPMDDNGHGTHVAGIIGAVGDNNIGVVGVNWYVKIMACKALDENGAGAILGWRADEVACLDYIADMKDRGVNIIAVNASYGDIWLDPGEVSAIDVLRQKGILFIAAAGNDGWDIDVLPSYPAGLFLPNLITVANTTSTDTLDDSSNYGRHTIYLGAPGTGILSTILPGNAIVDPKACTSDDLYCLLSGTSMATPFVTGVAALVRARNPSLDWRAIKNLILAGGDNISALVGKTVTEKRLNAHGALSCSNSTVLVPLQPGSAQSSTGVGEPLDLAALHINCAQPGGDVQVGVNGNESTVALRDNGAGGDLVAGDGIYSGQLVPAYPGSYTLDFPGGQTVTAYALRNYQYAEVQPTYRSITGASLDIGVGNAACYTLNDFQIQFGGAHFSGFCVSGNGLVSLTHMYSNLDNNPIPDPQVYNLIAPFWDQLAPEKGTTRNIYVGLLGTAPNRELVMEWRNVHDYACSSTGGVTFQVVFAENKDDILFNYKDVSFGGACGDADNGGSATVGIQVGQHTGTEFSYNKANLSDGMSILWTTGSLGISPSSLDFGSVQVGTTSSPKTVTLSNESGSTITISSIGVTGEFAQTNTCTASLAANANCKIDLTFKPMTAGTHNGELTINSSASGSPHKVSLTGSGTVGVVTLLPTSLDFGQQTLGTTSSPKTVTLKNDGGAALSVAGISTTGDFTETNTCGASLNAGQSCTIQVSFKPTATGTRTGQLTVATDAPSSPDSVSLSGTGINGGIVLLSATTLDFSDQRVGTTSTAKSLQLTNDGTGTLNLSSITASEPFEQNNNCGTSLASKANCSIQVTFKPTASGSAAGQLTITADDPDSPHRVDLTGTGVAPGVSLSPLSLDFGKQKVGTTSSAKSVTLKNTGTATLNISKIEANAPFIQQNNCESTLAPNSSCSVQITFKPSSAGSATGQLTVTSDAGSSPGEVTLTGEGAVPVVALSPTSLDFGQIGVNSMSGPKTVTLKNDGGVTLGITNIGATGDFTKSDTCSTSLSAGQSCTINVTFHPTATGTRTGQLTVATDASSSPDSVSLTGEGINSTISLSPTSLDFGDQTVGTESSPKSVTLTNSGSATVNITSIQTNAPFSQSNNCGGSLDANASCSIQVTFKPSAAGTASGQLTVNSSATGSPHSVPLTGNGTQPGVNMEPSSLDFGKQLITTSQTRSVTLKNTGSADMTVTSVGIYGDADHFQYDGQDCNNRNPIAPAETCTINMTFTPQTTGKKSVTLQVYYDAPGSPHEMPVTGQGTDFSVGMASGSSNSASVDAGQSANFNLNVAPIDGFQHSTTLSCTWKGTQPQGTSCSVSPSMVSLDGADAANVAVSVTTTARSMAPVGWEPQPLAPNHYPLSHLAIWLLGLAGLALWRRRRTVALASVLFLVVLWTACGGGGGGGGGSTATPITTGTPAGTYSLTVTGTTESLSHTTGLTLVVK